MSQANVSRGKAIRALRSNGMDIVNAIMVIKTFYCIAFENVRDVRDIWFRLDSKIYNPVHP